MTSQRERGKNMVLDHFKNIHLYKTMYPRLSVAIDYMQATDLSEMPVGRYEIAGDEVFIMIQAYEPKAKEDCKLESHKNYIDIQYVIEWSESIGYRYKNDLKILEAYNPEKDVVFYDEECDMTTVGERMFAIFFPFDAHMPGVAINSSDKVKKSCHQDQSIMVKLIRAQKCALFLCFILMRVSNHRILPVASIFILS